MSDKGDKSPRKPGRIKNVLLSVFKKKKSAGKKTRSPLAVKQVLSVKQMKAMPSKSQLRYLPQLLSAGEKRLAVAALALVIIAGGFLSVRLLNTQRSEIPAVGGDYTEGLIGAPQSINPIYSLTSDVDTDLSRLVYTGLMRNDSHHGLVPDLAESFTISEDQTVYTFKLREDVKWHDGKAFRPADVIFTINAIQTPEYNSQLAVSFTGTRIEQIDEYTVQFTLEEPFAPFLSLLTVGILPSHLWGEITPINAQRAALNSKPIGTGPYEFDKLVQDAKGNVRSYTFSRNSNFYRGAPFIETLTFKFYPDIISAIDALKNSNVEGLSFIPTEQISNFENEGRLQLIFPALSQYTAAFFNLDRAPLSDLGVRQALSHATDKDAIVSSVLDSHGRAIDSFILEGMLGEDPNLLAPAFDLDTARTKLQDAGWELQENSIVRTKDDVPLILEVVTLNSSELVAVAQALKEQWVQIGVDVQINTVDNATFQTEILKNRSYDILLSGELYGIDPDPYAFWHSSQSTYPGLNLSGFSNRNADDLIETGRSTSNRDDRAAAYAELQGIVNDTIPAIFLYQPTYTYAVAKRIQGIDIPQIVIPADRFSRIETWYIKTRRTLKKKDDVETTQNTDELKEKLEELEQEPETTPEPVVEDTDATTEEDAETEETVDNTTE